MKTLIRLLRLGILASGVSIRRMRLGRNGDEGGGGRHGTERSRARFPLLLLPLAHRIWKMHTLEAVAWSMSKISTSPLAGPPCCTGCTLRCPSLLYGLA